MDEGERHRGGGPRWTVRRRRRALHAAVALLLLLAGAVAEAAGRFDHGLLWQVFRPGVKVSHIWNFTGAEEALKAIQGHVLGSASLTGVYSLNPTVRV